MATSSCMSLPALNPLPRHRSARPPIPTRRGPQWVPRPATPRVGSHLAADDQDESDSEFGSRRILSTYVYISYGALHRNTVPCSQRGASYYNCYANSAQANPYTRGCTAITLCRS